MKRFFRARDYQPDPRRDVKEEFESHLELKVEDLVSQGLSPEEARAEAIRAFGDGEGNHLRASAQTRSRLRNEGMGDRWDSLTRDLRYALRRMARSPGFTLAAIFSLAVGIGANTSVFSVVNALLLRPLPYEEPQELVRVYTSYPGRAPWGSTAYPDYQDIRGLNDVFADVSVWYNILAPLEVGEESRMAMVEAVSSNFFPMLGVEPVLGRAFLPEEDREPGANRVAILGYGLWTRAFGADPGVLGRDVRIGGKPYTVVGVAPQSYGSGALPSMKSDIIVPVTMGAEIEGDPTGAIYERRNWRTYDMFARLRPDVTLEEVQARLDVFAVQLQEAYPESNEDREYLALVANDVTVSPEIDETLPFVATFLMAVVGLVLLLACTNLASFLLAQGVKRRKEIAVRFSMGAPRGRLVRQLLTETVLLGLLGGGVGLLLAFWAVDLLLALLPELPAPVNLELGVDSRVLLFSLALSVLAGILFGLVPALQSTRPDLTPALKDGASAKGSGKARLQSVLVAAQMAVSVILLVGGSLFVRALLVAQNTDPGFSYQGVGTAWVDLSMSGIPREGWAAAEEAMVERIQAQPEIRAVGTAGHLPLALGSSHQTFRVPGVDSPPEQDGHTILYTAVGADFFEALEIPIVAGRGFTPDDRNGTADVAVVSEAMAEDFWPGEDPVGRQIFRGSSQRAVTVVGVARDTKVTRLGELPTPFVYLVRDQTPTSFLRLAARGTDGGQVAAAMRAALREVNPNLAVMDVRPMEEHVALLLFPSRVAAILLGVFGGLALLLAAIGLYGVVNFSVSSRTREIGIRMSLGADRTAVIRSMMGGALTVVLVGGALGLAAAVVLSRVVQRFLFGVGAGDPVTLILVPGLLLGVAFVAALVPARRATRINPTEALRTE
jgi:predicted permease